MLRNVAAWILSCLLALSFLLAGWPKVMPDETMVRRFENWGYGGEFAVVIGIFELLGGMLVLVPKTAFYGAAMVTVLMVGAVYTHLETGIGSPVFAAVFLVLALVLGALRFDSAIGVPAGIRRIARRGPTQSES